MKRPRKGSKSTSDLSPIASAASSSHGAVQTTTPVPATAATEVGSVAQLFGGLGGGDSTSQERGKKKALDSTFGRLFSSGASGGLNDASKRSATASGSAASEKGPSAAALAALDAAARLKAQQPGGAGERPAKDSAASGTKSTTATSSSSAPIKKDAPFPKLSEKERAERDSRTIFVGNVPLDWDKKRLRRALKEATAEIYSGAFEPIWFRSEPLSDCWSGVLRKAASIKKSYATDAADAKNAYVMVETPDAVKVIKHQAQGLEADKNHFLRLDGVGEAAQLVNFDRKRSVFVGNLPSDTSEADMRWVFKDVGTVDAVRIVRDKFLQACKGFAFVRFKERSAVKAALDLWGAEVRGRWIRVMQVEDPEGEGKRKYDPLEASHPAAMRISGRNVQRLRTRVRKAQKNTALADAKKQQKKKKKGEKGEKSGRHKVPSFQKGNRKM